MRICDLASSILLSRSSLTRLVDRLAREGLLERVACSDDARGAFAKLTPAGREKLRAARATHLAGVRAMFLDLHPRGARGTRRLLDKRLQVGRYGTAGGGVVYVRASFYISELEITATTGCHRG